jgi:uncharacterized membrane protein
MNARNFFSKEEQATIVEAIKAAENKTSGEIRVHLENNCKGEVLDRCAQLFAQLKMHKTELRNGVLIYLAVEDKQFCIIGDAGINEKVADDFWEDITANAIQLFKDGKFAEGMVSAIHQSGEELKADFPVAQDDINELPDEISFGK